MTSSTGGPLARGGEHAAASLAKAAAELKRKIRDDLVMGQAGSRHRHDETEVVVATRESVELVLRLCLLLEGEVRIARHDLGVT